MDGRVVDEHVRAAVVGGHEAKALFRVKPFHGAFYFVARGAGGVVGEGAGGEEIGGGDG